MTTETTTTNESVTETTTTPASAPGEKKPRAPRTRRDSYGHRGYTMFRSGSLWEIGPLTTPSKVKIGSVSYWALLGHPAAKEIVDSVVGTRGPTIESIRCLIDGLDREWNPDADDSSDVAVMGRKMLASLKK